MTQPRPDASPPFGLRQEAAGNWTVLQVTGEIDAATAPLLREGLLETIASGGRRLVLDLSAVAFMDSTALGVLVGTHKRLRTLDGSLRLVANTPASTRILTLTGLDHVLDVFPTLSAALES